MNAPVTIAGEGDRDYEASYAVSRLSGSLSAANIQINHLDGVKGDVSIVAMAYAGDAGAVHDDRGITVEPGPIASATIRTLTATPSAICPHEYHPRPGLGSDRRRKRLWQDDVARQCAVGQARPSDRLAGRTDRGAPRQVSTGAACRWLSIPNAVLCTSPRA